jgi:hypothetical protein
LIVCGFFFCTLPSQENIRLKYLNIINCRKKQNGILENSFLLIISSNQKPLSHVNILELIDLTDGTIHSFITYINPSENN